MKILVTGCSGQVAQAIARSRSAHELVCSTRIDLDLADHASIERHIAAVRPDFVISAAAYTAVDDAEQDAAAAYRINGEAPGVIARAAKAVGAPVIHLSTDYVFGVGVGRPWREDDPVGPLNVYGASKLAGERAVAASGAYYVIVRTAWVYSPFGTNFVKTMLRLAETRAQVSVVEDQRGCPTSSFDIADALLALIDCWGEGEARGVNAIYHLAGRHETNWADFARAIFAMSAEFGGPTATVTGIPSSEFPVKAKRPTDSRLDSKRFAETFDYRMPTDWLHSLRLVISDLLGSR